MDKEDIRKRQIFGKCKRILISTEEEVYIVLTKDKFNEAFVEFLKVLNKRYAEKDVILTFTELIRKKRKRN